MQRAFAIAADVAAAIVLALIMLNPWRDLLPVVVLLAAAVGLVIAGQRLRR